MTKANQLSRRERQIMDAIYRLGEASVKEVQENIPDAPSYSSVRALLGKLVEKGHLSHRESGPKYVYFPLVERNTASRSALVNLLNTFFSDSPVLAVNTLLDIAADEISSEELAELEKLIEQKKRLGKQARHKAGKSK
ncbi:MAG: BlaI/MecI/CopY family transcriptional regulator [Gammaproteobacteria bacterium]|jgi:predicted transcriptional regulator|nr:BlaI/MecI/CopY family transcriptional regulator [Gammaproteobacteria bacterium]MDP6536947.1 BlaI/MecI/CopY family transcriptional regulator [Gammaproteobacteria bacterium]MDP6731562.1 BlaI/MecI/CopY family transcriptional regulator [Gammaproteobacteria bacterium]|tara:strand:- start:2083 stop:2496 length:414 start_codon:yes stop_codon:yes gene_type:complete